MIEEKENPISAAQRSKIRRLSAPVEAEASEAGGELNIVPFLDIVMNVLMFVLATIPAVFTATASVQPPTRSVDRGGHTTQHLNLSMVITAQGLSLKTAAFAIGPGCEAGGAGYTVPLQGGSYDWAAVKACARKLKDASPDYKEETAVTILADPGIPYSMIVASMDAVRESEDEKLFPDVQFGLPR
jgi:biopolymer transport protein ExbD